MEHGEQKGQNEHSTQHWVQKLKEEKMNNIYTAPTTNFSTGYSDDRPSSKKGVG